MTEEGKAFEEATKANEVLADPWFNEVLSEVEDDLIATITESSASETELREAAYFELQAMKRLRAKLKSYSDNWELAKAGKVRLV